MALNNVAKDSSNSSTPWFRHVLHALEDQDNLELECDKMSGASNGFRASSGFTAPSALDDVEPIDVTSSK